MSEITSSTSISRTVIWRRTGDNFSVEEARVNATPAELRIVGTVLAVHNGGPLRVDYSVDCDAQGFTRRVQVSQCIAGTDKRLRLDRNADGQWYRDGELDPMLATCTDIDLSITPSTNTLPIRRLGIKTGAVSEITAAWVSFPELTVSAARQSYKRVSEREYIYRDVDGVFTSPLEVDAEGVVQKYGDLWIRIADGPLCDESHHSAA